ncbi:MAG: N5-carboxyaminoimidazole ribonucleotide mutase [Phycisphaerae bacterium]|nr:N5-carboxyaminoimidazole ribonucleotide mutase [Phycisphaerae bacterium]
MTQKVDVSIVMGSDSDWPVMENCAKALAEFGVSYDVRVCSAHRSPAAAHEFASGARGRGVKVIIACAGMSAALGGVCAAASTLPVIGVPTSSGMPGGLDALLSTVQMPPGVPVAGMGLDAAGARNAGIFAVEILSLTDASLVDKLAAYKKKLADGVAKKNEALQKKLAGE